MTLIPYICALFFNFMFAYHPSRWSQSNITLCFLVFLFLRAPSLKLFASLDKGIILRYIHFYHGMLSL